MATFGATSKPSGKVNFRVIRGSKPVSASWKLRNSLRFTFLWGWLTVMLAKAFSKVTGIPTLTSRLSLKVIRLDGSIEDFGTVCYRVVTNTGVGFIVDAFQNSVELENMKYHGLGEGAVAENVADAALGTELTTEYTPDNTRATGTTAEGATANIYQTVATNTLDAAAALTEHGILSQAATGGGVLLDRSVFAVINLVGGDSLQSTYELTLNAGG